MRSADLHALMNHYLYRLDLTGRIEHLRQGAIAVDLTGHEDLIDMFEIACWLGPESGNVRDIVVAKDHASRLINE